MAKMVLTEPLDLQVNQVKASWERREMLERRETKDKRALQEMPELMVKR